MVSVLLMLTNALSLPSEPKLEDGAHVAASASLSIPVSSSGYPDTDPGGAWGLYGGHFWSFPHRFKLSFGFGFEHAPLNVAASEVDGNLFRWHPELRVGAGSHRVWGYGIIAPGLAALKLRSPDALDTPIDFGFDLNIGVGLSGIVWRGLVLGAELHFDFGHFGDETPRLSDPVRKRYSTLGPTFVAGWLF